MDYSAILMPVISETFRNKLRVIQNNALRTILKKTKLMNINNNPVILELVEEFKNHKGGRVLTRKTLLCDLYDDLSAGMNLDLSSAQI